MSWYISQFGKAIMVLGLFCAADTYYSSRKTGYKNDVDTGIIWVAVVASLLVGLLCIKIGRRINRGSEKPGGTS